MPLSSAGHLHATGSSRQPRTYTSATGTARVHHAGDLTLTVTDKNNATKVYGSAEPAFTVQYSGFAPARDLYCAGGA